MYGLNHHVHGEQGLVGSPKSVSPLRRIGVGLLTTAVIGVLIGSSGILPHRSIFVLFSFVLALAGAMMLAYESDIEDRISHWRR